MGQSTIGMLSLKTILSIFLRKISKIISNPLPIPFPVYKIVKTDNKATNEVNFWWKIENIV